MSHLIALPFKLELPDRHPFGFMVIDANGECVASANGAATSSKQRTRADFRSGVGFRWSTGDAFDRQSVIDDVARQEAAAEFLVAAANACAGNSKEWLKGYGECLHRAENAKSFRANLDDLASQRDDLLASLTEIIAACDACEKSDSVSIVDTFTKDIEDRARALVARIGGVS